MISRRNFLARTAAFAAASIVSGRNIVSALAQGNVAPTTTGTCDCCKNTASKADTTPRYRFAFADIMLYKRQSPGALTLTKEIGGDGVEVDMGPLSKNPTFTNKFAQTDYRETYLKTARECGLGISSIAMTGFFGQSFAARESYEQPLHDAIETAQQMGASVLFLPFGIPSDISANPALRPAVVERLKKIAPEAEKAGVTIGIETQLAATEEIKLLDDIGSKAIRSYFNFANPLKNKRNLIAELETLGKNRICQIHCTTEDGVWLQDNPEIKLPEIKQTLDNMGWAGWLVLERSRDQKDPRNVKKNFGANIAYLRKIFPATAPSTI